MSSKKIFIWGISFLLVALFSIADVVAQKPVTPPAKLQKGLRVEAYTFGKVLFEKFPDLALDELPQRVLTVDSGIVADYLKNYPFGTMSTTYLVWRGYLEVPKSKSYAFRGRHSGLVEIAISGKKVFEDRHQNGVKEKDFEVYLEKGLYPIEIKFLKASGTGYREMSLWLYDDETKKWAYLPNSWLKSEPKEVKLSEYKRARVNGEVIIGGDGSPLDELHPSFDLRTYHRNDFKPPVGALDFMADGSLLVSTWDSLGQVFKLSNLNRGDSTTINIKRIAWGLAEPLGLKVVNDRIFVLQKQELTELIDQDGDGVIDYYKTICNAWEVTGNFHEFAFGLEYKDGFFYAALAIAIQPGGRSTIPQAKDRGKAVKIGLDGSIEFIAKGLRTPNGIGFGPDGDLFIADNQGDWLPACKIVHVTKDAFFNNFAVDLNMIGRWEAKPPVVWLPQGEIGNSTSTPALLNVGPYKNQLVFGDVHYGGLQRAYIEKVQGEWQGAAFKMSQGLAGGTNRLVWGPDGRLYIGMIGSNGNWGQYGKVWYGLQSIGFNGKSTFEMLAVRAKTNGFEIEFTEPLKKGFGDKASHYTVEQWQYVPTMQYGGPKVNQEVLEIGAVVVSADRKKVFIELPNTKEGSVIYIKCKYKDVVNEQGRNLWTTETWYTLNYKPENDLFPIPQKVAVKVEQPNKGKIQTNTTTKVSTTPKPKAAPVAMSEEQLIAEGGKLIETSGCRGCHANEKMGLGPSFKAIAAKYSPADKRIQAALTDKVLYGGSGVWGEQAMPTHQHIGKEKIQKMVKWLFTIK